MKLQPDEAYGGFAYAYDAALGLRFFQAAKKLLDDALEKYPTPLRTHLDVACGTGLAMKYFRDRGWRSTGVDASLPMLRVARKRGARLLAADVRALPLRTTFARITCLYDSLNHLLDREELVAAFRAIRGVMGPDSLFFFDMNHPDVYPAIWGMREPYVASGGDFHLEIDTTWRARERMGRALVTGWAELPNGERVKISERHRQRAYRERDITDALGEAGLRAVEVVDFDPFGEAEAIEGGVKLFFVAGVV